MLFGDDVGVPFGGGFGICVLARTMQGFFKISLSQCHELNHSLDMHDC